MVDATAIVSAANGFKTVIDIAKGLQSLSVSTEVREKTSALLDAVVDARFKLLEASDSQTALLNRIKELERKIASFEDWNSEKERYQLQAVDLGAYAYMHKPGMEGSEPAVWLCQKCFEDRHKSVLQCQGKVMQAGGLHGLKFAWNCGRCKSGIEVGVNVSPDAPVWRS